MPTGSANFGMTHYQGGINNVFEAAADDTVPHIMACGSTDTAYKWFMDGEENTSLNFTTGSDNGDWLAETDVVEGGPDNMSLGGALYNNGMNYYHNGELARLLVFNEIPSESYLADLWTYLSDLYGIELDES